MSFKRYDNFSFSFRHSFSSSQGESSVASELRLAHNSLRCQLAHAKPMEQREQRYKLVYNLCRLAACFERSRSMTEEDDSKCT